jgi:hypothetical protein
MRAVEGSVQEVRYATATSGALSVTSDVTLEEGQTAYLNGE